MNLQELQVNKKTVVVKRALREHYNLDMNFDNLNLNQSQKMLVKIRDLLKSARSDKKIYESQQNPAYLKLVMIEQALVEHINDLRSNPVKIVVENEEVQKSQVILAAQEMIDTLQKMLEDISKMNVEELNAVVQGMSSEFGSDQANQFNSAVGQTLTELQQNIKTAKESIQQSLGTVTGDTMAAPQELGMDAGLGAEPDMAAGSGEEMPEPEMPEMEPEPEPEPSEKAAGRERR